MSRAEPYLANPINYTDGMPVTIIPGATILGGAGSDGAGNIGNTLNVYFTGTSTPSINLGAVTITSAAGGGSGGETGGTVQFSGSTNGTAFDLDINMASFSLVNGAGNTGRVGEILASLKT